ncbi:MAG TPA: beta-ketoacyl synthase N-terminal-like domain-containing protein [Phycisphaerales bacterium]|nr:beta-ketoacyl synthase N-terminal-like domain-containing protein [Phycisphaerales bacterium]
MHKRVFITGIGAVTGLGVGVSALWEGLCAGRSGIGPITRFDPSGFPCKLAAEVKDFSAKDYVPKSYRKAVKVMVRDTELAVGAAKLAVDDAGLVTKATLESDPSRQLTYPPERVGCHIGAGLICSETQEISAAMVTARDPAATPEQLDKTNGLTLKRWGTIPPEGGGGMDNLQPLWMLKYLPNMLACHVTIIHGTEGPSNTITCAEASGLLSIGESCRVIERGAADLCFSGGAESKLNLMGMAKMTLWNRLRPTDGSPTVRPYEAEGAGTIPGEAGGLLVLEEATAATKRGAKVYAEVAGFGAAHSIPSDEPQGVNEGLAHAIRNALRDAQLKAEDIDAIIPQGCGIASVDAGEAGALRQVFGEHLNTVELVTLTPALGDCAAGNGSILAAVGALCVKEQRLPARFETGGVLSDNFVGSKAARAARLRAILVCSSAQGGQNAALVLKSAN